jgi:toxin ParE1/3/4
MQQIVRSPAAQADAIEIWAYIAEDNAPAADRLLARFDEAVRKIVLQPFIGKSVHEIAPGIRFIPVGSYLIFYRVVDRGVEIVRILHGARDIGADFFAE